MRRKAPCTRPSTGYGSARCCAPSWAGGTTGHARILSASVSYRLAHDGARGVHDLGKACHLDRMAGLLPAETLVGVAGFEPAASSSRTRCSAGRRDVVPVRTACCEQWSLAVVRGRCCTSLLYVAPTAARLMAWGSPVVAGL